MLLFLRLKMCVKEGIHEKLLFLANMCGAALAKAINLLSAFLHRPLSIKIKFFINFDA